MNRILNFLKYHNAVPITVSLVLLSFGSALAASPTVRSAVYDSTSHIVAVDNTALLAADINAFQFNLKIDSVVEDDTSYHISYSYSTFAIVDGVWQVIPTSGVMDVSKKELVGSDLGLYVSKQIGQLLVQESTYLKEVQQIAKADGATPKKVAIEYSGLVGKFFDSQEEVFQGYVPVIPAGSGPSSGSATGTPASESNAGQTSPNNSAAAASTPAPLTETDIRAIVEQAIHDYLAQNPPASQPTTSAPTASPPTATLSPDTTGQPVGTTPATTTPNVTPTAPVIPTTTPDTAPTSTVPATTPLPALTTPVDTSTAPADTSTPPAPTP